MSVGSIISRFQADLRKKAEAEQLKRDEDFFYAAETDYFLFYRFKGVIKKHIIYDFSQIENTHDIRGYQATVKLFGQGVIKEKADSHYRMFDDYDDRVSDYSFFIERQRGGASFSNILEKDIIGVCHVNETAGFNQNNAKLFLYDY